ncbi:hypothetical protein SAMN05421841_4311 [Chryseobacterium wanjuense]|jgi:hypothetical protein|uniref:Uncharacterized protein n=1 Tax=Chryseobacterium wanjuense TaxID=356305 RepID=A0A1I0S4M8_9FLAO|nr:hypothetical protein [Chryseobacterium wanjuense]SEW49747.1 hypothetical protein SAMN05421841_4311 [Chryseobacterium wanjuense]
MFSKFNLIELLKDGFSEIRVSPKIFYTIFWHLFFPIMLSIIFLLFSVTIDNDIISNIISAISIFSGLLFSVIFVVTENYSKRKNQMSRNQSDEAQSYLKRYKDFTEQITTLILFSVAIAIISIVFLLLYIFLMKANLQGLQVVKEVKEFIETGDIDYSKVKSIVLLFLQTLSFIFLYNYLLTIITLVKEVYAMVFDDINYD